MRGRDTGSEPPPAPVLLGEAAGNLHGRSASGDTVITTAGGQGTLILVFSSSCQWCDSVAPEWAKLLPRLRGLAVVGLTMDSVHIGKAYLRRFGIEVPTISIDRDSEWFQRGVGGRTPVVLLFDSTGVLRFRGHGSQLPRALSFLAANMPSVDGIP